MPAIAELGFGLRHAGYETCALAKGGDLAKLVASATILNPGPGPAVNSNGALSLPKAVSSEVVAGFARCDGATRKGGQTAGSVQVRAVPPQPAGGRGQFRALGRVSGALRARHSGMARAGDARLPQRRLQRAIHRRIAPARINPPSAARSRR